MSGDGRRLKYRMPGIEGWLEYARYGRIAGVFQEWKDGWSMRGMVGWLEYAKNGRMARVCQEWKDSWSMPGMEG
jgi:hypothetical protein